MASSPAPSPNAPAATARRMALDEMTAAARLCRAAYDRALPWLAGRHTASEDARYFAEKVFPAGPVWGAFADDRLLGVVAMAGDHVDQLYVAPADQTRGVGSRLLDIAKAGSDTLSLFTFARNDQARTLYERRGFVAVEHRDGSDNEEGEPDVRYVCQCGPAAAS